MKLYEYKPVYFVRLQITQQKAETKYLTLCETNVEEVKNYLKLLIESHNISPFEKRKTSINIREAIGGKNGKSTSLSFHGLTPIELHDLIVNDLNKKDGKE